MARKFSTPGIIRIETDLSEIVTPAGTSVGAVVGEAKKGITNNRKLLSTDQEFVEVFGEPDSILLDFSGYGIIEYLKESNSAFYVRATDGTEQYANMTVGASGEISGAVITAADSTALLVSAPDGNKPDAIFDIDNASFTGGLATTLFDVAAIGPGTHGNDIGIKVTTTTNTVSAGFDWGTTYDDGGGSVTGGTIANKVFKVEISTKGVNDTAFDITKDPVETFLVSSEQLLDASGKQLEMENVINGNSELIYITNRANDVYPGSTTINVLTGVSAIVGLTLGVDGTGPVEAAFKNSAWNLFNDREKVQVNILLVTDITDSEEAATKTLQIKVGNLAATRQDCIAVLQVGKSTDTDFQTIIDSAVVGFSNPSYVALYAGYDTIFDIFNGKNIDVPKAIFGATAMARVDRVKNTWDAPAGIDVGVIPALDQNVVFNNAQIGSLYDANINTSKFIPGTGHTLFGQKTAQRKSSALDRINVRRLLLFIEGSIENALFSFLFKLNNDKLRLRAKGIIDAFLQTVKSGGGLFKFQTVIDGTNNPQAVIDNNQLNVDIFVQPTRVVEFIQLQIIITRTGVDFTELI